MIRHSLPAVFTNMTNAIKMGKTCMIPARGPLMCHRCRRRSKGDVSQLRVQVTATEVVSLRSLRMICSLSREPFVAWPATGDFRLWLHFVFDFC